MGHHPHQQKDSWSSAIRLLHYISQQQQSQGQKKLSNNAISVITYLDDILVIIREVELDCEQRTHKSSLDHETVAAGKSH